jgi:hypothetical protein
MRADVRSWHLADMARCPLHFCYRGTSGHQGRAWHDLMISTITFGKFLNHRRAYMARGLAVLSHALIERNGSPAHPAAPAPNPGQSAGCAASYDHWRHGCSFAWVFGISHQIAE